MKLGTYARELARHNKAAAAEHARKLAPIVAEIRASGLTSVREIRAELNSRGIKSARRARWHVPAVFRLLRLIDGPRCRRRAKHTRRVTSKPSSPSA